MDREEEILKNHYEKISKAIKEHNIVDLLNYPANKNATILPINEHKNEKGEIK